MGQLRPPTNPTDLPEGWNWANWSGKEDSQKSWKESVPENIRAIFWVRFREINSTESSGRRMQHTKAYYDGKIGKAKVVHPSPGWRTMYFRDGNERYITHTSNKGDDDHKKDMQIANVAREEHFSLKVKPKGNKK